MLGEDASEPALVRERETDEEKEDVVLVSAATASLLRAWFPRLSERRQSRHPRSRAAEGRRVGGRFPNHEGGRRCRPRGGEAKRPRAAASLRSFEGAQEHRPRGNAAERPRLALRPGSFEGGQRRSSPRNGHALAHAREALRGGAEVVLAAVLAVRTEKAVAFAAAGAERLRGALLRSRSSFKGMKSSSPPSVNRATRSPSRAKQ